ncbi:MAG TPA: HNH endonuclease signature motif containing protein [Streptosporangiaceae bacterium]
MIQHATGLLSGPAGLAAQLRTRTLDRPFTSRSQPLDVAPPTPVIPPHLRRAVTLRDQHCRFPGCTQPPAVSQLHHLTPRAHGGPTSLANLALLCRFHHLTVIHHGNWTLTCHPDGTTTATSPNGHTLHSHSPPQQAPAA